MSSESPYVAVIITSQSCGHCIHIRGSGFMEPETPNDKRTAIGNKYRWTPEFFKSLATALPSKKNLEEMLILANKRVSELKDPEAIESTKHEIESINDSLRIVDSRISSTTINSKKDIIARERDAGRRQYMLNELAKLQINNQEKTFFKVYALHFPHLGLPPKSQVPHPQSTTMYLDEFNLSPDGEVIQYHYYPEKQGNNNLTFVKITNQAPQLFSDKPFPEFVTSLIPDDIANYIPYFPSMFLATKENWDAALLPEDSPQKRHLLARPITSNVGTVKDTNDEIIMDQYGPLFVSLGNNLPTADIIKIAWKIRYGLEKINTPADLGIVSKLVGTGRGETQNIPIPILHAAIPTLQEVTPESIITGAYENLGERRCVHSCGTRFVVPTRRY